MEICVENTTFDHEKFSFAQDSESKNSCKFAVSRQKGIGKKRRKNGKLTSDFQTCSIHFPKNAENHKDDYPTGEGQTEAYSYKGSDGKSSNEKAVSHQVNLTFQTTEISQQLFNKISLPGQCEKFKDLLITKDALRLENEEIPLTCQTSVPDSQSNQGELSGKKLKSTRSKRKNRKVEEGILDLDRDIALLRRAGKKVREYFDFNIGEGIKESSQLIEKMAGSQVFARKHSKKSEKRINREISDEEGDLKVTVGIDIRPKQSKKISKKRKDKIVVKIARTKNVQQIEGTQDQEALTALVQLSKKSSNEDQMQIECTGEAEGMSISEEERECGEEYQAKRHAKSKREQSSSDDDSIPITLKARDGVQQERIGDKYQAEITPYNAMKMYKVRNFKQVWNPKTARVELIKEFNEVAETALGLKNINQGKLIKLLDSCEFNRDKFREMIEKSKGWIRNKLKLKRVWNESK